MPENVAATYSFSVWDTANSIRKTQDSGAISVHIGIDGGISMLGIAATPQPMLFGDATETGRYSIFISESESQQASRNLLIAPNSSTADIVCEDLSINFGTNVTQIAGAAVPNTDGRLHVLDENGESIATSAKQDTAQTSLDIISASLGLASTFNYTIDQVLVGTNNDKTGYDLNSDQSDVSIGLAESSIKDTTYDRSTAYPFPATINGSVSHDALDDVHVFVRGNADSDKSAGTIDFKDHAGVTKFTYTIDANADRTVTTP